MASGNGTNAEAIVSYLKKYKNLKIICVCNRQLQDAKVYTRLAKLGQNCKYLPFEKNEEFFKHETFDFVFLAGYMKILTPETLKFSTFVNIHPSLLPKFKGLNAIERTFYSNDELGGITIHYVNNELDSGEIIIQKSFLKTGHTLETFTESIHELEHKTYPLIIEKLLLMTSS